MEDILKKLPTWLILAIVSYVAVLVSYAVFDNRRVDLWPPVIHSRGESLGAASPKYTSMPWVSIETVTPNFPASDCPARLPAALSVASAANVRPATWGDRAGLWFGEISGNTVWLSCPQIAAAPVVIVGAAGPESDSTKGTVDLLVSLISK